MLQGIRAHRQIGLLAAGRELLHTVGYIVIPTCKISRPRLHMVSSFTMFFYIGLALVIAQSMENRKTLFCRDLTKSQLT